MSSDTTPVETESGNFKATLLHDGVIDFQVDNCSWKVWPPDYGYVIDMFLAGGRWERHNILVTISPSGCVHVQRTDPGLVYIDSGNCAVTLTEAGRAQILDYLRKAKAASNVE